MSLSDHIVFWARHAQIPELKPGQYIWFGKNGKRGIVRNRKSLSTDIWNHPAVREQFNTTFDRAFNQTSGLLELLRREE